ncbi:hypothetical protein BVY03_05075, partial [bacterium K02(2017)]
MQILIDFQKKYALWIVLVGLILTIFLAPRALKLLTKIATNLVNLLPNTYPNVIVNDEIGKKFKNSNNLFLIIYSEDPTSNLTATIKTKEYLEKLEEVESVLIEKPGYDFFDKSKFMLVGLNDLYKIKDQLKKQIHKKKLGGLYIDFEDDSGEKEKTFEDSIKEYRERFTTSGIS